jgi:hypothetical protein
MTESKSPSPHESADAVFKHWEWLRIVYNCVLAVVLIPWINKFITEPKFTTFVIECAVAANVAFCAGHVVEGYVSLLGSPRKPARYVLFTLGTLLAVGLELVSIAFFQVSKHP